jgi:catechol 2,3-dioxygenase-like lactoylglutathione lyase family enzyme
MTWKLFALALLIGIFAVVAETARAEEAAYHHVHLNVPNPEEGVRWYIEHMGCQVRPGRKDACQFGTTMYVAFYTRPSKGASDGSAVNHIGFSFPDLTTKMKAFEAAGVKIVTPMRDLPGLFKLAYVEDPWGTRIEVVEDPQYLGFHHIHLRSRDPEAALKWYQAVFGGQRTKLKGRLDGLLYGQIWLLVTPQAEGDIAPTEGRSIEHLGFSFSDLDVAAAEIRQKGFRFSQEPRALTNGPLAKNAFIVSPDGVRIEVAQP